MISSSGVLLFPYMGSTCFMCTKVILYVFDQNVSIVTYNGHHAATSFPAGIFTHDSRIQFLLGLVYGYSNPPKNIHMYDR